MRKPSVAISSIAILIVLLAACATQVDGPEPGQITLSIVGTSDVHGALLPKAFNGGMATFSGYVAALRAARAEDGGAVLLIDAGDMWQGSLESNLTEGAAMVEAYNALGYTAATIGNHEFDFGPIGELAIPNSAADDPRGALRQRITEANFPVVSANIVDTATGKPIDWDNVTPSTMTDVAGIKVGIIGLVTDHALQVTIAANAVGLEISPLADIILREARALRTRGADIIIVTAHAGGRCTEFDDPFDLSSCDPNQEIVKVANALPPGFVDLIIAGHTHQGMAHVINDIAVTSAYSRTLAFDRVDFSIDRETGHVLARNIFPPQLNCPAFKVADKECAWETVDDVPTEAATYEGRPVVPMASVVDIVERARMNAATIKAEKLGVTVETMIDLSGNPESPLGNLFTDAILAEVDADVAIHNVSGGIRWILPPGELTFGHVYEIMPFDNRVTILDMSGAELRRIIAAQSLRTSRRAGFSGMRAFASCDDGAVNVEMVLNDGRVVNDDDRVRVAANDFLATLGDGILSPAMPEDGFVYPYDPRLTRDLLVQWFKKRGGSLSAEDFSSASEPRWNFSESFVAECQDGV
jgi:5'-nucleotidase